MQGTFIFSKLNWLIKCAVQLVSNSENSLLKSLVRWSINSLKLYFWLRCYFTSRLNSSGQKYHSKCFAHNLANDLRGTCSIMLAKKSAPRNPFQMFIYFLFENMNLCMQKRRRKCCMVSSAHVLRLNNIQIELSTRWKSIFL